MKTKIISIGNSKGVRIPRALLLQSGLGDEVEIKVKEGEIKLVASPKPQSLHFSETYLLSLPALADWNTPEEDEAWSSLQ